MIFTSKPLDFFTCEESPTRATSQRLAKNIQGPKKSMTRCGQRSEHRNGRARKFKVPDSKFKETGGLVHLEP